MSYYFAIIGTKDNPLFEHEFGTSRQGGDGVARFREDARHMNQFIVHSSLDIVEEVQWGGGQMYLKHVDSFRNSHVFSFITGGNVKFMLLVAPDTHNASRASSASTARSSTYGQVSTYNPTAPSTEEPIRNFFIEVYDAWLKTIMSPFYQVNMPVKSPVFRGRVAGAAKKYL
ncbi:trafficking protein-like protein particle complex subunit 2 [Eremomyces bilateralis CBS 781.70]|uniref:Trafficking protein-like protein particle complex subunit 2 n=1 Tax=Eremomyces bilateralis CBS 781.70 TaxID=1392243 RepID=A0A6G1GDD8_9PEZI|nr:trafficking protein-like protein particle complex subunit 2 [Eremomyces bilateralis CBS 781.70]KAF1816117.1 trafficking protein-like protein particle complex subunit 2 [Eremomyces bilateralis CBS 781.70]